MGQHVSDRLPRGGWSYVDIDGVALRGRCLRVIEHKWNHSAEMGDGQRKTLQRIAKLVQLGITAGLLADDSGVFTVRSDMDTADDTNFAGGAYVMRMGSTAVDDVSGYLDRTQLDLLLQARPFDFNAIQGALL